MTCIIDSVLKVHDYRVRLTLIKFGQSWERKYLLRMWINFPW